MLTIVGTVTVLAILAIGTRPIFAQATIAPVTTAPVTTAAPVSTTQAFIANPKVLLEQNPNGGGKLSTQVRDLAASDGSTLGPIINLLKDANDAQKMAISDGLAQAAKLVVLTNQALAADIQARIAAINDPTITVAFTNALGDVRLGGVGGGALGGALGGAGAGGGVSNPFGGSSTLEDIRSPGTPTSAFSFTGNTVGATGTTVGSNLITPVSPSTP
jgi:hypothetical protein